MNPTNPTSPTDPPQQQPGTYPPPQGQGDAHTMYSPPYNQPYGQPPATQAPGSTTGPGSPPAQQPEVYNSPSLAATPYGTQPVPQPQVTAGGAGTPQQYTAKKGPNKLVIIIIAGVSLLLLLIIIAVIASSGQNSADKQANQAQQIDTSQLESLQPAQAIDLEEASNAISQDMSSLDDERDFPADSLDDKTLGL